MSAVSPVITADQLSQVAKYTGAGFIPECQRAAEFLKEQPTMAVQVVAGGAIGVAVGAAIGGGLGSLAGMAAPPIAPFATKVGAVAGGVVVGCLAVKYQVTLVLDSQEFREKTQSVARDLYPIFKQFLPENELLEFSCSISTELIVVPLRGSDCQKHQFEAAEIRTFLESRGGQAPCPVCRKELRLGQLVYDTQFHERVFERLGSLLPK